MKETKRAERRSDNARLLKKRFKEELKGGCWRGSSDEGRKWALWRARKRVTTNVQCSCALCASPRKLYGNGVGGLTFAERRSLDAFRDGTEEWAIDYICN